MQWAHISVSPGSRDRGFQRLICLKYYNVLKLKSRFAVELNAAKNTDYIKIYFK